MPLEAMSSALYQNRSGIPICERLIARKVVVERLLGRNPRFLQLHVHKRQAVHASR